MLVKSFTEALWALLCILGRQPRGGWKLPAASRRFAWPSHPSHPPLALPDPQGLQSAPLRQGSTSFQCGWFSISRFLSRSGPATECIEAGCGMQPAGRWAGLLDMQRPVAATRVGFPIPPAGAAKPRKPRDIPRTFPRIPPFLPKPAISIPPSQCLCNTSRIGSISRSRRSGNPICRCAARRFRNSALGPLKAFRRYRSQ